MRNFQRLMQLFAAFWCIHVCNDEKKTRMDKERSGEDIEGLREDRERRDDGERY